MLENFKNENLFNLNHKNSTKFKILKTRMTNIDFARS